MANEIIKSQTINCKKYKQYGRYSKTIVTNILNELDIKKEFVLNVDDQTNFLRGIHVYLPNRELYIRLWDVSHNGQITTTRYSVFEDELSF